MAAQTSAGRPRKPTALKALQGTDQPCRTNKLEPKPEVNLPAIPETLKGTDAGSWESIGKQLEAMRVITGMDQIAFELLCGAYGEYITLRGALWVDNILKPGERVYDPMYEVSVTRKDGSTHEYMKARPEVAMLSDSWRRLEKMLSNFGLTPSSRTKVQTVGTGGKGKNRYDDLSKK